MRAHQDNYALWFIVQHTVRLLVDVAGFTSGQLVIRITEKPYFENKLKFILHSLRKLLTIWHSSERVVAKTWLINILSSSRPAPGAGFMKLMHLTNLYFTGMFPVGDTSCRTLMPVYLSVCVCVCPPTYR